MATVCLQCGDRGFYEALIDCEECKTYAVHLYCLPILPASFEDDVIWYCEDCEPKVVKPSISYNPGFVLAGNCNSENLEIIQETQSNLRPKNNVNISSHHLRVHHSENHENDQQFKRQWELDERTPIAGVGCKNNPLQSFELPCGDRDKSDEKLGRLRGSDGSSSDEEAESIKRRTCGEATNDHLNIPECSAHKETTHNVCSGNDKKDRELVRNSSIAETEAMKSSGVCEKSITEAQCKEGDEKGLRLIICRGSDGGNSNEEPDSMKNKISLATTSSPSNIREHSCYTPGQPIIEPIWKGSLRLSSDRYGTIEGLVAHLSTLACLKVFEEAKLLSELLFPELLPRSNAWPKSFPKSGPTDYNIALYFFPDNERAEVVYDSLVDDMMSRDFALRATVKNAELLVFTSNILPSQFRSFQSKFYLWGVFRAKQASQSQPLAL